MSLYNLYTGIYMMCLWTLGCTEMHFQSPIYLLGWEYVIHNVTMFRFWVHYDSMITHFFICLTNHSFTVHKMILKLFHNSVEAHIYNALKDMTVCKQGSVHRNKSHLIALSWVGFKTMKRNNSNKKDILLIS